MLSDVHGTNSKTRKVFRLMIVYEFTVILSIHSLIQYAGFGVCVVYVGPCSVHVLEHVHSWSFLLKPKKKTFLLCHRFIYDWKVA